MMEEVVEIVNQLQDVFLTGNYSGFKLPQIVVVGSQSAGKSSVLEKIVGKNFLPRGTGMVTRCPLVLQLVQAPADTEEYGIFQHDSTKRFTDYDHISKEIEEQTVKLAGVTNDICHSPINLKIHSPSLINLTLVDLPGLVKVPVGDQPADIEEQTRKLILKYIENPNSIILAVTAANNDLATSESLKIAKEVDPHGTRTLAVLTKLDLMDKGTDARDMLNGKVIPIKLGIIGVVNRSQKDIYDNKTIRQTLQEEAEFLKKNYEGIAALHGSLYLARTVQAILVNHIKKCMPDLQKEVSQHLKKIKRDLTHYSERNSGNHALLLNNLILKFTNLYSELIKGCSKEISTASLFGGAKIHSIFKEEFADDLNEITPLDGFKTSDILTVIKNSNGLHTAIVMPETAFEFLAKSQIERFRNPSMKCVESIHNELNNILQICLEDESLQLERYPKLQIVLCNVVTELLQSRLPITNKKVEEFMDIQTCYINTSHPDFLPKEAKVIQNDSRNNLTVTQLCLKLPVYSAQSANRDKVEVAVMKGLVQSYMSIVSKTVKDYVPKIIIHSMVNFVVHQLHDELTNKIFDKENHGDILYESPESVIKRNELKAEVAKLEKAENTINTISRKTYKKIKS